MWAQQDARCKADSGERRAWLFAELGSWSPHWPHVASLGEEGLGRGTGHSRQHPDRPRNGDHDYWWLERTMSMNAELREAVPEWRTKHLTWAAPASSCNATCHLGS